MSEHLDPKAEWNERRNREMAWVLAQPRLPRWLVARLIGTAITMGPTTFPHDVGISRDDGDGA